MPRPYALLAAGLALMFALVPAQQAQAQVAFGPQLVLWDIEELGIGARVDFGLADTFGVEEGVFEGLFGSVNGSYLLVEGDGTFLVFNGNVSTTFETEAAVTPFAGAGINLWRTSGGGSSDTASGLNLLGGLFFDLGTIPAFGELQYSTTGTGGLTLSGGVLFGGNGD